MAKKITLAIAECILILSLGTIFAIGITGGFSIALGPLIIKANHLKNPFILLIGALVIRKILIGRFVRGLACVAFVRGGIARVRFFLDKFVMLLVESQHFRKRVLLVLLLFGILSVGILLIFYGFSIKRGLTGNYYDNVEWAGLPIMTVHDRSIDVQRMKRLVPPHLENYSIEWRGVIDIPKSKTYRFTLVSDDGSFLYLDKQLVVDNGGYHGFRERSGMVFLEKGFHPITIRYLQGNGEAALKIYWTRFWKWQERLSHVFLFPEKPEETAYLTERILSIIFAGLKFIWLICFVSGILIFLNSRRIILPLLRSSPLGRVYLKLVSWIIEDEEEKPVFSVLPKNFFPVPRVFFLLLIGSFFLNVWGISWGLPGYIGWVADELTPLVIQNAIRTGFSWGWLEKYPPFHYYLLTISYIPFFILHRLNVIDLQNFQIYTILFYLGRFVSVLMGTAIVFLVYLCGCELYEKRASLFAALITALMPSFLYYSKNVNLDIPYMFWFVLSLFFYIRILKYHRIADYLLFSATATLSLCTKDQAYGLYMLTSIGIISSHYLYKRKRSPSAKIINSLFNRKTLLSLLLAVIIFIVIHNILLNVDGFLNHLKVITGSGSKPFQIYDNTIAGHAQMLWQSLKHLRFSFGWPIFLTCTIGVIIAFFQKKKNTLLCWIVIPGISYYLTFISIILYNYVRFLMPICIILAFFGGKCLSDFLSLSQRFYKTKIIIVSVIFIYTFLYAASVDILMAKDSRYYVETWMEQNIDENASIGLVGIREYLPRVTHFKQIQKIPEPFIQTVKQLNLDYIIINSDLRFRKTEIYNQLHDETFGYKLVLQHRSTSRWVLLNQEDIIKDGRREIFTSLDKINPEIKIFKRIVDTD